MAVVEQALGNLELAEAFHKKTVYLDPNHEDSLLALEHFAIARADHGAARDYARRVRRGSERRKGPKP